MFQKAVLPNGLRVVSSHMPHIQSVSIGVFIGAGSRYEERQCAGISHFIEHLLFKGTEQHPTSRDIAATIDGVGGVINGGTDKESTVYWCKVSRPHFPLAVNLLADMIRHSLLTPDDIASERRVIAEELSMEMDSPAQRADMLINELLWPDHPLGREIVGNKETITSMTREMFVDFVTHQYSPPNVVVAVAGGISDKEVIARIEEAFADWRATQPPIAFRSANGVAKKQAVQTETRKIEQVNLCLAVPGLPNTHPDRFVLDVFNSVLSGGMSSRLFVEIRDKRALAYDIHSFTDHLADTGAVIISAGVSPTNVESAITAILGEVRKAMEDIPESELAKAKEYIKGRLLLRMEDSSSVSNWIGAQELLKRSILTVDDVNREIDAVTAADMKRVSQQIFTTDNLRLSAVGPVDNYARLEQLLRI